MTKKIAVVLAGCGAKDGAEIHEATLTLYFLAKAGVEYVCVAPNKPQADVVDHRTATVMPGAARNVLVEAARIARGDVRDIATVSARELDGVIVPGGFGAAKNLCTFAVDGANCTVDEGVAKLLRDMHGVGKPIGALCIAPVILAKLFGPDAHVNITLGAEGGAADAARKMGAKHTALPVRDICTDEANRVVTTPCYMFDASIADVGVGIEKLVAEVLKMAGTATVGPMP